MNSFTDCLLCGNTNFNTIRKYCSKCGGMNVEYPLSDWHFFAGKVVSRPTKLPSNTKGFQVFSLPSSA